MEIRNCLPAGKAGKSEIGKWEFLLSIFYFFPLLSSQYCHASAGSANDEIFFILAIIAVMLFILLVLYSIDFVRKIIREGKKENNIENEHQKLENGK